MRKSILFASALGLMILGMSFENIEREASVYYMSGAPEGHSGSPADGKNCTACHMGTAVPKSGIISSTIPVGGYIPGDTYMLTITLNNQGTSRFGFQITPQNNAGTLLGAWGPNTAETQVLSGKYATHKTLGTSGSNSKVWTLQWTAPSAGTGAVTFYGAFNISNADNTSSGDVIWLSNLSVPESGVSSLFPVKSIAMKSFVDGNSNLHIQWKKENASQAANIRLLDLKGIEVAQWSNQNIENQQWHAKLPELQSGVYIVNVNSNGIQYSEKILIRK